MKWLFAILGLVTVLLLTFFAAYSFHPQSQFQLEVKHILDSGEGEFPFSPQANSHMWDVFHLLTIARYVALAGIILSCFAASKINYSKQLGILTIGLPIVVAFIPWEKGFVVFHEVFFPQGNWMFPSTNLLIQTYPQEFFMAFSVKWGILLVLAGVVLICSSLIKNFLHDLLRRKRRAL